MRRNIYKYAAKGHDKLRKADNYSLSIKDLNDLMMLFYAQVSKWGSVKTGACEVIVEAYAAGFEAGTRYERKKHK